MKVKSQQDGKSGMLLKSGLLLFCIIVGLSINSYGEPLPIAYELNGFVKDSITGEGLPFATIQVLTANDSSFVKAGITNGRGNYSIPDIQSGRYVVVASYMGYHEKKTDLSIRSRKEKLNFNLLQKSISVSEVSVVGEQKQIEKTLEKTTINVSKNTTVSGGTAIDVMKTLPSVDFDIDGNINYRGSEKVVILIDGEKSELAKALSQIPAEQVNKVELINNPSAKYDAEGMSGIINVVLKKGKSGKNKTTLMLSGGYPENASANIGYSTSTKKTTFFINSGIKHNTKYQIKEHLRENYENTGALDYAQYDRQDENLNNVFLNTNFNYRISKKQKIGLALVGAKTFNNADRVIDYQSLYKGGAEADVALKEIDINLDNYTIDGALNYRYSFENDRFLSAKVHYSLFDQLQTMNNQYYPDLSGDPELQNTNLEQINKQGDVSVDYMHPINDNFSFETGYKFDVKDLMNDFSSETAISDAWLNDAALANKYTYLQKVHAVYFSVSAQLKIIELQAGLRSEFTSNIQNDSDEDEYFDFFPTINVSHKINKHFTVYAGYNRRINRPTIKMLNPFSNEYADLLNMHRGNPDLKPEYVNSFEIGNKFVFNKFSGMGSLYYRDINQAISRVKTASNDSALYVSFINLENAKLYGGEVSLSYKPFKWWNIQSNGNVFYTNLSGKYSNNYVDNSKIGWNISLTNNFKLPKNFGFQTTSYFRSKLPSVMGIYKERYYMDIALNKKILDNKGQLILKVSDVFNCYEFGLNLDAIDENGFRYSQANRRKNESRYFILSFVYNIDGKSQQKKKGKKNFFLEGFDK